MIGHNRRLIEYLGSEAVVHRTEKPSEIHMAAEVAVGFDSITYTGLEPRDLLVMTHTLEIHSSTDRQMLDAGMQLDYMAEGQRHNCCLYRRRLASY